MTVRHRFDLTGFRSSATGEGGPVVGAAARPHLDALLAEVGLELWQAPEGFWAIRSKPQAPTPVRRPKPR